MIVATKSRNKKWTFNILEVNTTDITLCNCCMWECNKCNSTFMRRCILQAFFKKIYLKLKLKKFFSSNSYFSTKIKILSYANKNIYFHIMYFCFANGKVDAVFSFRLKNCNMRKEKARLYFHSFTSNISSSTNKSLIF